MKWYQSIIFLVIYTLGFAFLVFGTLADGHGTFLFASLLIPWLLFVGAFFLIPSSHKKAILNSVVVCIALYYLLSLGLALVEQTGAGNLDRTIGVLRRNPLLFVSTLAWYLAGQLVFWVVFIRKIRQRVLESAG